MKLTTVSAYELLIKDVLNSEEELGLPENRWVKHCINVGYAASIIADNLGLDADYAGALGIIHDIGRKISHPKHPITGYQYMIEQGYVQEAGICLTHSFINNDIRLTAGAGPTGEAEKIITDYFKTHELTIYDKIIQLCDLFCLDTHLTTIPDRLYDIYVRKGVTEDSRLHIEAVLKLKEELEELMGCSLYDLFPEISVDHIEEENEKLNSVINR